MPPPWKNFAVGVPSDDPKWTNNRCREFDAVTHITHLHVVPSLLHAGYVRAGPVFDESKLRKHRIFVSWLSPNDWYHGSRYGNVQLSFEWKSISKGMRAYWVESLAHKVPAVRILLTDQNRDGQFGLEPYDPAAGDGPWWFDASSGRHYRNGEVCLELMLERNLNITEGQRIDFVEHHAVYCNDSGSNCPDRGLAADDASARFLALVVGAELGSRIPTALGQGDGKVTGAARWWRRLNENIVLASEKVTYAGPLTENETAAAGVARAAMAAFSRNSPDWHVLAGLFNSQPSFLKASRSVVANAFSLDGKALKLLLD